MFQKNVNLMFLKVQFKVFLLYQTSKVTSQLAVCFSLYYLSLVTSTTAPVNIASVAPTTGIGQQRQHCKAEKSK